MNTQTNFNVRIQRITLKLAECARNTRQPIEQLLTTNEFKHFAYLKSEILKERARQHAEFKAVFIQISKLEGKRK